MMSTVPNSRRSSLPQPAVSVIHTIMSGLQRQRLLFFAAHLFLPLCFGFAGDSRHHQNARHLQTPPPTDASSSYCDSALPPLDREQFLRSIVAGCCSSSAIVASASAVESIPSQGTTANNIRPLKSVREAVDLIGTSCNKRFLYNVVASDYNFLYHGLDPQEAAAPSIMVSKPCDLLNPETYGSEEAAAYFARLDKRMAGELKSPVRPSNGHLATTCPKAAGDWGVAASIWPIGEDNVHFAWYADGGLFWPRPEGASQDIIVDGRDCGKMSLEDALSGDNWEVLFRADKFVAIPVKFEEDLRKELEKSFVI